MRPLLTTLLGGLLSLVLGASPAFAAEKPAPWVGTNFKGVPCRGDFMNFGPYDYMQRAAIPDKLRVVERRHFTPSMEQLTAGEQVVPNIDYTLRAWPNHHRALYTIIRVYQMGSVELGQRRGNTPECYLQRAINFSPRDPMAHMLFGIYLQREGRPEKAMEEYRIAEDLDPGNMQIKYNLGLLLARQGDYDEARQYAVKVYNAGFPLPGLREQLERAGYWSQGAVDNSPAE